MNKPTANHALIATTMLAPRISMTPHARALGQPTMLLCARVDQISRDTPRLKALRIVMASDQRRSREP
jgi:hypothetical protein